MKSFVLALLSMPLVLSSSSSFFARANAGVSDFEGKTINLASTDNEAGVKYIYGDEIVKSLKGFTDEDLLKPSVISELNFAKNAYRIRYDKYYGTPFNYGSVSNKYYVEGFEDKEKGFFPKNVSIGDKVYPFQKISYQQIATIDGKDNILDGYVNYDHHIALDRYTASEIVNAAYNVAVKEAKIEQLNKEYREYLNYLDKVESYNDYLRDLNTYNIKVKNLEQYYKDLSIYEEELEAYQKYINEDLPQYKIDLANYQLYSQALATYNSMAAEINEAQTKYNENIPKVNHHLELMELFFTRFPLVEEGGTIQSYINRGAVDQVIDIKNEALLETLGISDVIISRARDATNKLRALVNQYSSLRGGNSEEAKKTRYSFYIDKYQLVKVNLISLTQCLEKFYQNTNVKNKMEELEKTQRYKYLLAELIYTADAFSDSKVKGYDFEYSGTSSNNYYLTPDLLIDDETVLQILGLESGSDKTYSARPLSSYPLVPGEIYKKPNPKDFGLDGKLAADGTLPKIKTVEEPIKPVLGDYNLTQKDLDNEPEKPLLIAYGLHSYDFDGDHIKVVEKPSQLPPERNYEYDDLLDAFSKRELLEFTPFEKDVFINVEEHFRIRDFTDAYKFIAVMWIKESDDDEAKVHEIAFYSEGESPELIHDLPVTAVSGGQYKYFNKWYDEKGIIELEQISGTSIDIKTFPEVGLLQTYNVIWIDEDGNELLTTTGYENFKPVIRDENNLIIDPSKESTDYTKFVFEDYTYTDLNGQVHQHVSKLPNCEEIFLSDDSLIITVNFTEERLFTVRFVDDEDNLYEEFKKVSEGERVSVSNPIKEETDSARYEFDHWEINNVPVTMPFVVHSESNIVTIKAVFNAIHKYTIIFSDGVAGHEPYSTAVLEEGKYPYQPLNVKRESNDIDKYYEFKGWNSEITPATSDKTYIAQFEEKKVISNANITKNNQKITVTATDSEILDFGKFIELHENDAVTLPMDIIFDDVKLTLNESQVRLMYSNKIYYLGLTYSKNLNDEVSLKVIARNSHRTTLTTPFSLNATITNLDSPTHMRCFSGDTNVSLNKTNSYVSFNLVANTEYKLYAYYHVTFDELANATFFVDGESVDVADGLYVKKGTELNLSAVANEGSRINKINVVAQDDLTNVLKSDNATSINYVVNSDVMLTVITDKIKYKVSIFVDNYLLRSYEVEYGKTFIPDVPEKEGTSDYYWVFTGWQELDGTSFIVTQNTELHATFTSVNIIDANIAGHDSKEMLKNISLLSIFILGSGFIVFLFIVLNKKNDDDEQDTY